MKKLTLIMTILALGSVYGADAFAADTPSPQEQQFALAAQPAVKIVVRNKGWYTVSRKALVGAGLSPAADARLLQLYDDGRQVPILVRSVKRGRLASNGSIEFYGRGRSTRTTDRRTYWLVVGSKPGQRVAVVPTPSGHGRSRATSFAFTSTHRDHLLFTKWPTQDGSYFYGKRVNPSTGPVDQAISVKDLDPLSGTVHLRVAMHGVTTKAHKLKLTLNGKPVSVLSFEGQVHVVANFLVSRELLKEGSNVLTLEATAGELDFNVIDEVSLTYARLLRTDESYLNFAVPESERATVTGFTDPQIRLVDIANAYQPRLLMPVVKRSGGGFAVTIGSDGRWHRYLAMTTSQMKHPAAVIAERPSAWHRDDHGADLLIISHRNFISALQPLVALRERQGLKVATVDVQDVFDEFSHGAHGPDAVKRFVMWTRVHWHPAPRFLLLVGDATYDPRNFLGAGQFDLVPTKLVSTRLMEPPSDGWFGDADQDGIPEIAIGRLPVRTKAQAQTVVSKIVGYDSAERSSTKRAFLIADADGSIDFNGAIARLGGFFPTSFTIDTARRSDGPSDAQVRARILAGLNQGPTVVDYFGHGAEDLWSAAGLFASKDAENLHNGSNLSLYLMMSCLNGFFVEPAGRSLAEALLEAKGGGAAAVISSAGVTDAGPQPILNQEFLRLTFSDGPSLSIGEALNQAKLVVNDGELRQTELLFGDPSMHLRY